MNNEKVIVLDTETTNDIECPFVYDVGFAVVSLDGEVFETHSYTVADIFLDTELMSSAYFADKIPQYWDDIKNGKRLLRRWKTIKSILKDVCEQYNIHYIFAHNAIFDWKSCTTTQRFLTSSKYRYFFPYGIEICDTLKMSREVLNHDEQYSKFCAENNYLTKNNKNRLTAEIIYRFLTKDNNFTESHTGLEDVMIEKEIMKYCFHENPNIDPRLWARDGEL